MNLESSLAVVGMAVRFPGAADLAEYWRNLAGGVESITRRPQPPQAEADAAADPDTATAYTPACGLLTDPDCFDAELFGFAPRDALIIDPQQRIFLECAWEALEHAGYDPARYPGLIGIYAGSSQTEYAQLLATRRKDSELLAGIGEFALRLGGGLDFLTSRVAYKLGLRGPAVTVQTACSTSLVAIHLAGQSLLAGECDMALAGGVTAHVPAYFGEYSADGIISADGRCRAFDARAGGTVGGDGAGIVVLKRLETALEDGDTIHAVLLASAINNDGADKVGYTAPSVTGQAEAARIALCLAKAAADSVTFVETHGTGTPLGDPIEIAALTSAFASASDPGGSRSAPCWIGSVKTNIGHTDAAAGVAGFVKAVLALQHRELPPSLHFTEPHPGIDFGPFEVNTLLRSLAGAERPLRAGVNSLGIGGTNAHVLLEEAPEPEPAAPPRRRWRLIPVSAHTRRALTSATARLADAVAADRLDLADIAWTSQIGRAHQAHRRFVVADGTAGLVAGLTGGEAPSGRTTGVTGSVVFAFPGQGGQHVGMTRDIYAGEPAFAAEVDRCAELFRAPLGEDLRDVLYGDPDDRKTAERLEPMPMAQACVFTVEYALAQLWSHWGVQPDAVVGHSLGAYAAACVAGVFDLPDAVTLVAARSRLLESLPAGAMLAVPLPEPEVRALLPSSLDIAAVNAAGQCVVSGPRADVEALLARLPGPDVDARMLRISAAAHSALVDPVAAEFRAVVAELERREPRLPMVSDHSGTWLTGDQATDPGYWSAHLRGTVRFADALTTLLTDPAGLTLLEAGPGRTLAALAGRHPARGDRHTVVTSLPHASQDTEQYPHLLDAAGRVWLAGHQLDWAALHDGESPRRVPLPTYPFQRMRYRVDPDPTVPVSILPVSVPAAAESDGDGDGDEAGHPYVAPRTATETEVAAAFVAILGVRRAGVHDSFLDLGGDSVIAAQMTAWIKRRHGVSIPVRALFRSPTVEGIASTLDKEKNVV